MTKTKHGPVCRATKRDKGGKLPPEVITYLEALQIDGIRVAYGTPDDEDWFSLCSEGSGEFIMWITGPINPKSPYIQAGLSDDAGYYWRGIDDALTILLAQWRLGIRGDGNLA